MMRDAILSNRKFFGGKTKMPREPLRTARELAEEFGVSVQKFGALLRERDGPKPVFRHNGKLSEINTWYSPTEVRVWWRGLQ